MSHHIIEMHQLDSLTQLYGHYININTYCGPEHLLETENTRKCVQISVDNHTIALTAKQAEHLGHVLIQCTQD